MEGKYYMSMSMQLNVFYASKLFIWFNYMKSPFTKKKMNHGKYVTPEEVSTSTNLNICNILLHGKTIIPDIERQYCFFKYFFVVPLYYWLIMWLSFFVQ
jgi:hypothetical protein